MSQIKEITGCAFAGGNSDNGANAGPFYLNSNNAASNADVNIGASLENIYLLFSFRKENIAYAGNSVLVA